MRESLQIDSKHTLNFSYGSNLLPARLRERVPSAQAIARATLWGYELRWHKNSDDQSGKCDVVKSSRKDAMVLGVVYQILLDEKPRLDLAEGLGIGYDEKVVSVESESGRLTAHTYVATKTDIGLLPYSWYKALVVAGAREHRFPASYIEALEAVESKEDQDRRRHDQHMALVNGY